MSRIGEPASLFRNVTPGGESLARACDCAGGEATATGSGAMVRVTAGSGRQQWNRVTTAVGYASSSDRIVQFGMGADAVAREVEVRWPGGAQQKLANIACDRIVDIEEPQ